MVVKFRWTSMLLLKAVRNQQWRGFAMSSGAKKKLDRLKVAVLGCPGCGKTALTVRFLTRRFIGDYERSKEQMYQQNVEINGQRINFEILDTALEIEECLSISASFERVVKWADAFVIVFDVTDARSLRIVPHMKAAIDLAMRPKSAPSVLVGNKIDLVQSRVVTRTEGSDLARLIGVPFAEVSVRESYEDVAELFSTLFSESRVASPKPTGVLRGLRERSKRKGRFSMLTRQRSVSM